MNNSPFPHHADPLDNAWAQGMQREYIQYLLLALTTKWLQWTGVGPQYHRLRVLPLALPSVKGCGLALALAISISEGWAVKWPESQRTMWLGEEEGSLSKPEHMEECAIEQEQPEWPSSEQEWLEWSSTEWEWSKQCLSKWEQAKAENTKNLMSQNKRSAEKSIVWVIAAQICHTIVLQHVGGYDLTTSKVVGHTSIGNRSCLNTLYLKLLADLAGKCFQIRRYVLGLWIWNIWHVSSHAGAYLKFCMPIPWLSRSCWQRMAQSRPSKTLFRLYFLFAMPSA